MDITADDFKDAQLLEKIWRRAVQLAVNHEKDKFVRIVKEVCSRLCQISLFESAAELYEQINMFEDAVAAYCEGANYDAARECLKLIKNPELNAKLADYIDRRNREANKSGRDPWSALKLGDYETAC